MGSLPSVTAGHCGTAGGLLRSIPKSCYSAPSTRSTSSHVLFLALGPRLLSLQFIVFGDDTKAPATPAEPAAADQLYRAGKFAEAEASYQALLKTDSKLVPAHGWACSGNVTAAED